MLSTNKGVTLLSSISTPSIGIINCASSAYLFAASLSSALKAITFGRYIAFAAP